MGCIAAGLVAALGAQHTLTCGGEGVEAYGAACVEASSVAGACQVACAAYLSAYPCPCP